MKKFTHTLALQLACITSITICMDTPYPQLQLQENSTQLRLNAELQLNNLHPGCLPQFENTEYLPCFNVPIHTPCISVKLTVKNPQTDKITDILDTLIPSTILYNCYDNSQVEFPVHFKSHYLPKFDNKIYVFKAICKRNIQFSNDSFKEQYDNSMKCFYEKGVLRPYHDNKKNIKKLSEHSIIDETIAPQPYTTIKNLSHGGTVSYHHGNFYKHGINGCSTKEKFIELMTQKNTKHYQNSVFNYIMQRQAGKAIPHIQELPEKDTDKAVKIETVKTVTSLFNLPNSKDH